MSDVPLVSAPFQRVAVFRARPLGAMIGATPALRVLRAAWPTARLTLIGLPEVAGWASRQRCIDDFVAFPGWRGLPEQPPPSMRDARAFVASMRRRRFDLALQLHGCGAVVNPLVVAMGAQFNAGFVGRRAWRPPADRARFCRWPDAGSEAERVLALTDHLQLPRQGAGIDFPLLPADRSAARALLAGSGLPDDAPYAVLHPGPDRAGPCRQPTRFTALGNALAQRGLALLLTGSDSDAALTAALRSSLSLPQAAHDLAGRTDAWTLGALIEAARVVVCDDPDVSTIAAALAVPHVASCAHGAALLAAAGEPPPAAVAPVAPCRLAPAGCDDAAACTRAVDSVIAAAAPRTAMRPATFVDRPS